MVSRGQELELTILSAAYEGTTVARVENLVVFVPFGVPGDRVWARVVKKRRKFAEAVILKVLEPSPLRAEPRCGYFGTCGGCRLQNVQYESQLEIKRGQVQELLERIGGLTSIEVPPVLGCPNEFYYRNKMEFSFGSSRWLTAEEIEAGGELDRDFALGLHIPKRFDKILDIEECFLQDPRTPQIVNPVRALAKQRGWSPYNTLKHEGFMRNLVIRMGMNTSEIMVNLVTSSYEEERAQEVKDLLLREVPAVTTILNTINSSRSPVASGDEQYVLHGDGLLRDRIGHVMFQIAPTSFFQPNTIQAECLFSCIKSFAQLTGGETLFDLFCGLGSIGLFLANSVQRVVGIESHADSVEFASANARLNGIENAEFVVGDSVESLDPGFLRKYGFPDVVILDPPRAGLHPDVCEGLLKLLPKRIVYTSCNPATQARDLKILGSRYDVRAVQPVDMFPQTYHIENVAQLELRG